MNSKMYMSFRDWLPSIFKLDKKIFDSIDQRLRLLKRKFTLGYIVHSMDGHCATINFQFLSKKEDIFELCFDEETLELTYILGNSTYLYDKYKDVGYDDEDE